MKSAEPIQLGELCARLGVPLRHARYLAEQELLPSGVDVSPDRGNHRQFAPGQAFWLGLVLKLKESGVKAPLAASIANFVQEAVERLAQAASSELESRPFGKQVGVAGFEPGFSPFDGQLETESEWYVDVGDLKYVRITTDYPPYSAVQEYVWSEIRTRRTARSARPVVIIRLDLARLAALLRS